LAFSPLGRRSLTARARPERAGGTSGIAGWRSPSTSASVPPDSVGNATADRPAPSASEGHESRSPPPERAPKRVLVSPRASRQLTARDREARFGSIAPPRTTQGG